MVKARIDSAQDREALFQQHMLPRAGDLVPAYLGNATVDGVHVLTAARDWRRIIDFYQDHGFRVWYVELSR